jgi:hypothetical protein
MDPLVARSDAGAAHVPWRLTGQLSSGQPALVAIALSAFELAAERSKTFNIFKIIVRLGTNC